MSLGSKKAAMSDDFEGGPLVLSTRRGAVAVLTLNDSEHYNALDGSMLALLSDAMDRALDDPGVRAVLLTGAGRGFCAGARLDGDVFESGAAVASLLAQVNRLIEQMRGTALPIVVAVNGPAAGAGVGLALAGDVVIAARSARFVFSFARLGAALDAGTSFFIQQAVGAARTRALTLLGHSLPAEVAAQWGLIWEAVDDNALLVRAYTLADQLAAGPSVGLGLIKRQLQTAASGTLSAALVDEADSQVQAFATEDLREGARAFMEKRAARFAGR